MKTDLNNKQYTGLLAKYLSGEMNGTEASAFEAEIARSEGGQAGIEKLKKQWLAMKNYENPVPPDTRKAWDKLYGRLQEERLIPEKQVAGKRRLTVLLMRVAAAVLILAAIGAVVFLNVNRKSPVEMVSLNTDNEANTLVKTLADGSIIYVAQHSLFSFPEEFESGSRHVELKGEAFFDVAINPRKPFIIETDEALIEVLGTAFNVKTKKGEGFELFVERGKVKVTLKSDPSNSQFVIAGEKISALQNGLVKSKHLADEGASWYKHRMHFKDETLQQIIHVLNLNFNTTFVLADQEIGKYKLTVTFENETPETMTELICMTLNLKSQIIHGDIVFSENGDGAKRN